MNSSRIVVSGATGGIGRALVLALASHPSSPAITIIARDPARVAALAADLATLGKPAPEAVLADLSTLAGARAAVAAVRAQTPCVDVLIHNAGIWPTRRELGPDGFEASWVTNHLAPFVLTRGLADLIPSGGRIIQVTAGLYPMGRLDLARTPRGDDFSRLRTYANTKLANVLATRRWAEHLRARAIDVHAIHPGVVRTSLGASRGPLGWLLAAAKLTWAKPATGALGPLRLATDPAVAGKTDVFWDRLKEAAWVAPATDLALTQRVWDHAANLVGDA